MISVSKLTLALAPATAIALADDDGDGVADAAVQEEALASAEREVRQTLTQGEYNADAALSPLLEDIAVTLAVERLYERRREVLPGPWKERGDRARLLLREIGAGRHPLFSIPRKNDRIRDPADDSKPLHRAAALDHL